MEAAPTRPPSLIFASVRRAGRFGLLQKRFAGLPRISRIPRRRARHSRASGCALSVLLTGNGEMPTGPKDQRSGRGLRKTVRRRDRRVARGSVVEFWYAGIGIENGTERCLERPEPGFVVAPAL